ALRRSRLPALPTPFPYPTLFRSPPPLTSAPPSALPPPPWRGRPYPVGSGSREEAGPPPASRVSSARRSCGSSAGRRVVTRTVRAPATTSTAPIRARSILSASATASARSAQSSNSAASPQGRILVVVTWSAVPLPTVTAPPTPDRAASATAPPHLRS